MPTWTNSKTGDGDCSPGREDEANCLGQGTYGKVYMKSKRRVTKSFSRNSPVLAPTLVRQMAVMTWVGAHPNLLTLCRKDNRLDPQNPQIIFARMHATLRDAIHNPKKTHSYTRQLLSGMAFLHSKGVVHRDLKPSNILLNTQMTSLKIADWDLATTVWCRPDQNKATTPEVVSLGYRPPEILMGYLYPSTRDMFKIDSWSLGVVIYFLATGNQPFLDSTDVGSLFRIFRKLGSPSTNDLFYTSLPHYRTAMPAFRPRPIDVDLTHSDLVRISLERLLCINPHDRADIIDIATMCPDSDDVKNNYVLGESCPYPSPADEATARTELDGWFGQDIIYKNYSNGTKRNAAWYLVFARTVQRLEKLPAAKLGYACFYISVQMHEYDTELSDACLAQSNMTLEEFKDIHAMVLNDIRYCLVIPQYSQ